MKNIKEYLFWTSLTHIILTFSNAYLSGQIMGSLTTEFRLSFKILFVGSTRNLLMINDTDQNHLSLRMPEDFYERKEIICNFNGVTFPISVFHHDSDSVYELRAVIKRYGNTLSLNNDNNILLTNIFNKSSMSHEEKFQKYSASRTDKYVNSTIFVLMGNLDNRFTKHPYPKPFMGCIDYFFINFKPLLFASHGENFSLHCLTKTVCKKEFCKNETVTESIFDCSLNGLDIREGCYKNLTRYMGEIKSYKRVMDEDDVIGLKLVWRQNGSLNNCLVEIRFSKRLFMLLYTNEHDEILFKSSLSNVSKTIAKLSSSVLHILLIKLTPFEVIIKISNGQVLKTYSDSIYKYPSLLNIGFISYPNICRQFIGEIDFHYNTSQFRQSAPYHSMQVVVTNLVPCVIFINASWILILLTLIFFKKLKKQRKQANQSSNLYESVIHIPLSAPAESNDYEAIP